MVSYKNVLSVLLLALSLSLFSFSQGAFTYYNKNNVIHQHRSVVSDSRRRTFVALSSTLTTKDEVKKEEEQKQQQLDNIIVNGNDNIYLFDDDDNDSATQQKTTKSKNGIRSKLLFWKKSNVENTEDDVESNEDGYYKMRGNGKYQWGWYRQLNKIRSNMRISRKKSTVKPGTLILIRHGESEWNANKTFTGWADPDINEQGKREAEHAARLLLENGYEIDVVFTSRLQRAIRSTWIILQELNEVYLPVFKSWRLNERMYGALTGLCKKETAEQLGHELVQEWRGSLRSQPPPLTKNDVYYPGYDRRYIDLTDEQVPKTESLEDCMIRTIPIWENKIKKELQNGQNVMVVAHANTLRGLVKTIDNIGDDEIQDIAIPTGIPIVYKFDPTSTTSENELKVIRPDELIEDKQTASQIHMNGFFLEKPGLLKVAMTKEQEWCEQVPGYNSTISRSTKTVMSPLERSLNKLVAERNLGEYAMQFQSDSDDEEDDGTDGKLTLVEDEIWEKGLHDLEEGDQFDPDGPVFHLDSTTSTTSSATGIVNGDSEATTITRKINIKINGDNDDAEVMVGGGVPTVISNRPCVVAAAAAASGFDIETSSSTGSSSSDKSKSNLIVIIRHGKTENNKLGLFTGWDDVPLAKEGITEAINAGQLLKTHGFEFDVVYTSWLSRAIETAWFVMDELDCLWLPIIKSWRLNERMYGELTGLSKRMVKQRHGDKQFKAWRRGYKVKPPPVSSFSPKYPGNDKRYDKYLSDARYSIRESIIRSIDKGKISITKKLPKSESLKDCMDRTIPYFANHIVPESIQQNKRVLISSSENAIRGLLMYLCDIPEERICELEIPNGLPLIYDMKSKCLKLLDDGSGQDPLEKYNFGPAGSYLFKPCQNEDGSPDEECDISFWRSPTSTSSSTTDKDIEATTSNLRISDEDLSILDSIKNPQQ